MGRCFVARFQDVGTEPTPRKFRQSRRLSMPKSTGARCGPTLKVRYLIPGAGHRLHRPCKGGARHFGCAARDLDQKPDRGCLGAEEGLHERTAPPSSASIKMPRI